MSKKFYNSVTSMKKKFMEYAEYIAHPDTGEIIRTTAFMQDAAEVNGCTIFDLCRFLKTEFNRLTSFSDKIAFLAVLSLGCFSDDEIYYSFYLPSTAECMKAYKKIEKKFKNHERIMVEFTLGNDGIEVDFFSAKPIQCIYWDAEGWLHIKRY